MDLRAVYEALASVCFLSKTIVTHPSGLHSTFTSHLVGGMLVAVNLSRVTDRSRVYIGGLPLVDDPQHQDHCQPRSQVRTTTLSSHAHHSLVQHASFQLQVQAQAFRGRLRGQTLLYPPDQKPVRIDMAHIFVHLSSTTRPDQLRRPTG